MSANTRHTRLREECGDIAELSGLAVGLVRQGKRSELQRKMLRRALQLFKENRLAAVLAGFTGELPQDILPLLSRPIVDVLPGYAMRHLREYHFCYVGEILLHPRPWSGKIKAARACRDLLSEWGIPFDLDLNSVGWVPPYAEDPKVVTVWNMRLQELAPGRALNATEEDASVGEFVRELSGVSPIGWRHPSRRCFVDKFQELGLRPTMFVPASWNPPARDPQERTISREGQMSSVSLDSPVGVLGPFEDRLARCLDIDDIKTVGDLVSKSETDLARSPQLGGHRTRQALKEALAKVGLALKPCDFNGPARKQPTE